MPGIPGGGYQAPIPATHEKDPITGKIVRKDRPVYIPHDPNYVPQSDEATAPGHTNYVDPNPPPPPPSPTAALDAPPPVADRTGTVVAAPVVDTTAQDEARRRQSGALDLLEAGARGETPSVAENSIVAAMNRASRQRMGMAAGARGGDALALQREASIGVGQDALEAGSAGAMARAAEMTGARGALADATTGQRGQDIGLATEVAGLEAQIGTVNGQIAAALAAGDQQTATELLTTKAELDTRLWISKGENELKKYGIDIQAEIDRQGLRQEWEIAKKGNDTQRMNGIIQGLTVLGAAAISVAFPPAAPAAIAGAAAVIKPSDERLKSNVSQVPDDELDAFARKISEAVYSYDRKDTGQHEIGTMAQEVAGAGPLGREVTGDAAPGVKGVDYGRLALLMSAAALRSQKERV